MIERRLLSAEVVSAIADTTALPVGLAHAPSGGGWTGAPNLDGSNFTPYCVVTPNTATLASGSFDEPQGDRQLPYTISSFGVMPE